MNSQKFDANPEAKMKSLHRITLLFVFAIAFAAFQFGGTEAQAYSSFYSNYCSSCHATATSSTCNGCHKHGPNSLDGTTDKSSYAPGETVTVTMTGGSKSGWFRATLYDHNGQQVAISNGNESGMGHSTTFPAVLSAPAPTTPGTYTWEIAWFGNSFDSNNMSANAHGEVAVSTNPFTVTAPADTTAPVISDFSLPVTATSLSVPVTSLSATDDVEVTGYLITSTSSAPAAGDAGWSATAPSEVTAPGEGSHIFYAWAKDAAGNVSVSQSATVTVTLPDTAAPVIGDFSLPATASSLSVPVTALNATDDVEVTGYLVTTSSSAPVAGDAGWTAAAPSEVTAPGEGSQTFYAWAKDAAGNVSASQSATVTITLGTATPPELTVSALADASYTNEATVNVSGTASDPDGIQAVTVNGQPVSVGSDGSFSTALSLVEGSNTITVVATDNTGSQQTDSRTVTYDPTAPVITVSAPADNSSTTESFITVSGTVSEPGTVFVTVNGNSPLAASMAGNDFSATVNLEPGVNTIEIDATDLAGNTASAKRTITHDIAQLDLAVTEPAQDITTGEASLLLQGTVTDATGAATVHISMDGQSYTPEVQNGAFQQELAFTEEKQYAITVTATDEADNSSTVYRNVIYRTAPAGDDDGEDDGEDELDEDRDGRDPWADESHPGKKHQNRPEKENRGNPEKGKKHQE